jgi:hypothetical protein
MRHESNSSAPAAKSGPGHASRDAGRRLTGPEPPAPMLDSPMFYVLAALAVVATLGLLVSAGSQELGRFGFFVLLYLATALLACGWLSARTMQARGRSVRLGWALGLVLGVPGLLLCAFLPIGRQTDGAEPRSESAER